MPVVLYESKDFGISLNPLWSGSVFFPQNIQIYADIFDTYIVGLNSIFNNFLTKIDTSPDGGYTVTDYGEFTTSSPLQMTHYFGEIGLAQYSVVIETTSTLYLMATEYPEQPNAWVSYYPPLPQSAIDVVFPDMVDSPRFVIGFQGNTPEKVYVVLAQDQYLSVRYATDWTALASGSSIKDLEVVRFI